MSKVPKISLHIFAISPEKHGGEVYFLPANKHESFLQVHSVILVNVARHVQSTQNNKLQYLKENVKYEVYFLPADKRLGLFKRILSFQV